MARILHLSDLHFRPGDPDDRDSAGRALLMTVADWTAEGAPPDLVLVSGDLVERGDAAAYPVAGRFLDRLRQAAGGLPAERVLCVPGNHDVQRPRGRRLQRTLTSLGDAALFFGDPAERTLHLGKLAGYREFVDGYFGPGAAERPLVQLTLGGLRVGVLLLWSAWFSQDDDDREQLWIGAEGVAAAGRALADCDLTVALLHHGPEWLHPLERPAAFAALAAGFDLVCHGHLHGARPPEHEGTPLSGRLLLAAGSLHRRAQRISRAFLMEASQGELTVRPLQHRRGGERWETDETLGARYVVAGVPRSFALPQRRLPEAAAPPPQRSEDPLPRYLAALAAVCDAHPAAVRHPTKEEALLLRDLYIELVARSEPEGDPEGVHGLLREGHLALCGPPGAGKSATARHVAGQLARLHLGMPSGAGSWLGGEPPVPALVPLTAVRTPRPAPSDLKLALDAEARRLAPDLAALPPGAVAERILAGPALLVCDDLAETPPAQRPRLLGALRDLCAAHPQARLLLCLRPRDGALLQSAFGAGPIRPRLATLLPLRLTERLRLIDRFVQATSAIPVGMTLFGGAAALDAALRRVVTGAGAAALGESPLLLTALCWVGARYGLVPQRAELLANCLGALVENRLRPEPAAVGALIDEMAESSAALRDFRAAQALEERPDPWDAVRLQLDEPDSYGALRLLAGLLARRSREAAERLLRALLSEAGGRLDPGARAQLVALAAQLLGEMAPYQPEERLARRVQEELARLVSDLEDRLQRTPLPVRIAIAEGLGRAGDPRLPLDLLDPGPAGRALWVEVPAGRGLAAVTLQRYPLTSAQLWHLVSLSGYAPPPDGGARGARSVRELWQRRAVEQPNHPAVNISWEDALFLCRLLSQADWRYRYDIPTEAEWERAVRHGADEDRFYPWGASFEPSYCNTGRRVGRTTPVGVFPAGTAAGGAGCADLIGNVWQWCQGDADADPTLVEAGGPDSGQLGLEVVPEGRVARGGSFAYLRTGAMRATFPGTRSDEIGLRLARRSK